MTVSRIVATAPIDTIAVDILEKFAPVETAPAKDEETLLGYCDDTIAFVSRGTGAVTTRMIQASDALKVIGRPGVGYDTVDVAEATRRKIPVVIAPVGAFAVAEGALAMLLSLVKRLPESDAIVKTGQWDKRFTMYSGDMTGHTIGIVGFGRIGSHLAKLLTPFEMTILAFDPHLPPEHIEKLGATPIELDELLRRSDYVSLHVPLIDETRGLIGAERIGLMKRGAILVNTSRGDVIDNLDILADALDAGQLAAVALDVFPGEPPDVSHRLFKDGQCLCAPHLVGGSRLAMERIFESMATDMVAVLQGGRPQHCVNNEVFE
jgi:D-3-phosphoglycerate dehydrogenase